MGHQTRLSETNHMRKLMDLPLLKEQDTPKNILNEMEPEPVQAGGRDHPFRQKFGINLIFLFPEGNGDNPSHWGEEEIGLEVKFGKKRYGGIFNSDTRIQIVDHIANYISRDEMKNTILKFIDSKFKDQLEGFIKIGSNTSSSGEDLDNYKVGAKRLNFVRKIMEDALSKVGFKDTRILDLINDKTKSTYDYSDLSQHMDPKKVPPSSWEQFATLNVSDVSTLGLETDEITGVEHDIEKAIGWNINPNEDEIVNALERLKTYSDIVDLDKRFEEGLQKVINDSITDGWTSIGSDTKARKYVYKTLNKAAKRSGKVDVAAIADDKITISLNQ